MRPKPVSRAFANHFLKQLHVNIRQLVVGIGTRIIGNLFERAMIVSALHTAHVGKKHTCIDLLGNSFGAGINGCVLMKKVNPLVNVNPARSLVGYETYHSLFSCLRAWL